MIKNIQEMQVEQLRTYVEVLANWEFFLEGLQKINGIGRSKDVVIKPETLLRVLMDCVVSRPTESIIYIVRSKNNKPLAYIIAFDTSDRYHDGRSLLIYALYSNKEVPMASLLAFQTVEQWARDNGYSRLQAFSPRTSGAFLKTIKRVGLKLKLVFFSKDL